MSSSTAVRSASAQATKSLSKRFWHSTIEPRQAAAHRDLPRRLVDHHEVHELGHAGIGGAARSLVLRNDDVHEHAHQSELVRREELRRERLRRCRRASRLRSRGGLSASASVHANVATGAAIRLEHIATACPP